MVPTIPWTSEDNTIDQAIADLETKFDQWVDALSAAQAILDECPEHIMRATHEQPEQQSESDQSDDESSVVLEEQTAVAESQEQSTEVAEQDLVDHDVEQAVVEEAPVEVATDDQPTEQSEEEHVVEPEQTEESTISLDDLDPEIRKKVKIKLRLYNNRKSLEDVIREVIESESKSDKGDVNKSSWWRRKG